MGEGFIKILKEKQESNDIEQIIKDLSESSNDAQVCFNFLNDLYINKIL